MHSKSEYFFDHVNILLYIHGFVQKVDWCYLSKNAAEFACAEEDSHVDPVFVLSFLK